MERAAVLKSLRSPLILAIIGGTVLVLIIWLVAVFLPQGSKVNKLNSQAATLQTEQNALNAKVIQLKRLKNAGLERLHNQYTSLVPSTPNTAQYLKQINAIVAQSGCTLSSVSLALPLPPAGPAAAAAGAGKAATPAVVSNAYTIGVSLQVTGTYDDNLKLIQLIYNSPRLTTIGTVSLTGGGPTSNRSTPLTADYVMTIYELPNLAAATTTTTTAAA
jgi:Tfp pilus assembly protein PilO